MRRSRGTQASTWPTLPHPVLPRSAPFALRPPPNSYDFHILDMAELLVSNLKLSSEFPSSFRLNSAPALLFVGADFEHKPGALRPRHAALCCSVIGSRMSAWAGPVRCARAAPPCAGCWLLPAGWMRGLSCPRAHPRADLPLPCIVH